MTKIKIKQIVWDDYNTEHIKKHNVTVSEVEVAAQNIKWHKGSRKERYMAGGRSGSRILTLIIQKLAATTYYLVTARDSDKKERRKLYDKEISGA